ncbi:LysM peptidoglycan-binding domain-containing protein [Limibacter armeniacum]|uniref:LysM peptidoglycan-binding domain-containing protein n=1 Tax=Limibacter armeniacum TaxID=466084 RepID=UPI002FE65ADD
MRKTLTILLCAGALSAYADTVSSIYHPNVTNTYVFGGLPENQLPDNPYPIISDIEVKTVNGEEITLANANGIPAFIAGDRQTLLNIAAALNISMKKIISYNDMNVFDELKSGQVYYLKSKSSKGPIEEHIVVDEASLWEVSQRYGIKLKKLAKFNRMETDEPLQLGRVLFLQKKRKKSVPIEIREVELPEAPEKKQLSNKPANKQEDTTDVISITSNRDTKQFNPNASNHTVRDGESIFMISRMYNVTILDLKAWNDIGDDLKLKPGQVLKVKGDSSLTTVTEDPKGNAVLIDSNVAKQTTSKPNNNFQVVEKTPKTNDSAVANGDRYVVQDTDQNIVTIASKFNVSYKDIKEWNNLNSLTVKPGQVLIIKQPNNGSTASNDMYNQPAVQRPAETQDNNQSVTTTPATQPADTAPSENLAANKHMVQRGETLYRISKQYNVSVDDLLKWNNMSSAAELKSGFPLYIAAPENSTANTTTTASAAETTVAGQAFTYTVKKGEDIYQIGYANSITPAEIRRLNNLPATAHLQEGQQIKLIKSSSNTGSDATASNNTSQFTQPAKEEVKNRPAETSKPDYSKPATSNPVTTPTVKPATSTVTPNTHLVIKGETLYAISRQYNIPVSDLQTWNGLTEDGNINAGQTLKLRDPSTPNKVARYHVISKGETLYSISRRYKVSIKELKKLNKLADVDNIPSGTRLRVQ